MGVWPPLFGWDFLVYRRHATVGPRPLMKRIDVAIAVVVRAGRILICQRKPGDTFGGFWEFPGGKCEGGESPEACLARELREELDITPGVTEKLVPISHDYPHVRLTLHPFLCTEFSGEPKLIECQRLQWVEPAKLRDFRFPPANAGLLDELVRRLSPPVPLATPSTEAAPASADGSCKN